MREGGCSRLACVCVCVSRRRPKEGGWIECNQSFGFQDDAADVVFSFLVADVELKNKIDKKW